MKIFSRLLDLILLNNLFVAVCTVAMCMATEQIMHVLYPVFSVLHAFVFGCTLLIYNLPPIANKPGLSGLQTERGFFFLAGVALTGATVPYMPAGMLACALALGVLSVGYCVPLLPFWGKKRLRDHGWVKTTVLAGVWTLVTYALPVLYHGLQITAYPMEALVRFSLLFALCVLFDMRDLNLDAHSSIRTLPHRYGTARTYRLIFTAICVFLVLSIGQYFRLHEAGKVVAAIVTTVALAGVVQVSKRRNHTLVYLVLADGIMLLYSLLVIW